MLRRLSRFSTGTRALHPRGIAVPLERRDRGVVGEGDVAFVLALPVVEPCVLNIDIGAPRRQYHSDNTTDRCGGAEPEVLDVEVLLPEVDDAFPDGPGEAGGAEESLSWTDQSAEIVHSLDTFARAKVLNFIKRGVPDGGAASMPPATHTPLAQIREVQSFGDDGAAALFYARIAIPLPVEYGERWGEGMASTEKDAEAVAAMHAERVVDALGFPMFQLTSKQKRHAEAARSAGRWAPLPGEEPRHPSTKSPPRLHYVKEGARQTAERQLHLDNVVFSKVSLGAFTPLRLTLASPYFLDEGSTRRVKHYFMSLRLNIQRYCRIIALHAIEEDTVTGREGVNPITGKISQAAVAPEDQMFVAQIKLPVDARFGERLAMGKAPVKREAYTLACMHAELIVDALGLELYPLDAKLQRAHAMECKKVGRWCVEPGEKDFRFSVVSPPPLQLSTGTGGVASAETQADDSISVESVLLKHSQAISSYSHVRCIAFLDREARGDLVDYLAQHRRPVLAERMKSAAGHFSPLPSSGSPFIVEVLGIPGHHTYRASIAVPVLHVDCAAGDSEKAAGDPVRPTTAQLPSFVAIGIGSTEAEAEAAAAMHALCVLCALNRPIFPGSAARQALFTERMQQLGNTRYHPLCQGSEGTELPSRQPRALDSSFVIPPPFKLQRNLVGRIVVPGLADPTLQSHSKWGAQACLTEESAPSEVKAQLAAARAALPRDQWSLEADTDDGYILVSPNVSSREGRNYVHSLGSVRHPDGSTLNRLRDYLERNGKTMASALKYSSRELDGGMRMFRATVVLPVPERFETCVAVGEGYTQDDATLMCAMHAELMLDSAGVSLYDHVVLQNKHAIAIRSLGRWATPMPNAVPCTKVGDDGANAKRPRPTPPLRKEHAESVYWINHCKKALARSAVASAPPMVVTPSTGGACAPPRDGVHGGSDRSPCTVSDDELCDLSKMEVIHRTEFHRNAARVVQNYLSRRSVVITRDVRQYNVQHPQLGTVHRAILELPVPPQFGKRYAVGCASTKREAYQLVCMHSIRVLDALGIPLYQGGKQNEYAQLARVKGRYAPRAGDTQRPGDTPSPPGLKCMAGGGGERPDPPEEPSTADYRQSALAWPNYVGRCKSFIAKINEQELYDTLIVEKRCPRSGVDLEDRALDIVESMPVNPRAKLSVSRKCAAVGLPAPPPFRYEIIGKLPSRAYYVETSVIGTPFVARGAGDEPNTAIARACMHYECVLNVIFTASPASVSPTAAAGSIGGAEAVSRRASEYFDSVKRDFTTAGKHAIVSLFTSTHPPFQPVRLTEKVRAGPGGSGTIHVSLMDVEDESGLRITGKGEHPHSARESRERSLADLFRLLQAKTAFQSLVQLIKVTPSLRIHATCMVHMTDRDASRIQAACVSHSPIRDTGHANWQQRYATLPVQHLRRLGHDASNECESLADLAMATISAMVVGRSALEDVGMLVAAPLSVPASVRKLLPALGLARPHETPMEGRHSPRDHGAPSAGSSGTVGGMEITEVGMATALIASFVPWPVEVARHGTVLLQLSKLILAGLLLGCPRESIRVAACAAIAVRVKSFRGNCMSYGAAESRRQHTHSDAEASRSVDALERQIGAGLRELRTAVTNSFSDAAGNREAATHGFAALLNTNMDGSLDEDPAPHRLPIAIAFSAFPSLFVPIKTDTPWAGEKSDGSDNPVPGVSVLAEARDNRQAYVIPDPACLDNGENQQSIYAVFDDLRGPNRITDARSGGSPESPSSSVPSQFAMIPLWATLFALVPTANDMLFRQPEDIPNILLVDEHLTLATTSASHLQSLLRLQSTVAEYWSALELAPEGLLAMLDGLFDPGARGRSGSAPTL